MKNQLFRAVQAAVLVAPFLLIGSATAGPAFAAPAFQHRHYPGSDSSAARQDRDARDAPNMYCEKHENEC